MIELYDTTIRDGTQGEGMCLTLQDKLRILDGGRGTSALTRVLFSFSDGESTWHTVGASRNIIEASWRALFDSFEYGLLRAYGDQGHSSAFAESA